MSGASIRIQQIYIRIIRKKVSILSSTASLGPVFGSTLLGTMILESSPFSAKMAPALAFDSAAYMLEEASMQCASPIYFSIGRGEAAPITQQ